MMPQSHSKKTKHTKGQFSVSRAMAMVVSIGSILVFTILCIALYSSNQTIKDADAQLNNIDTAPLKVLTSQQVAESKAYTISIADVMESDKHDPAFTIADNETLLVATISIKNNTSAKQDLYPVNQMYIRSKDGLYFQMHPSMYVLDPLQAEPIEPGQTVKGQISFAVPKELAQPLLYIDLGWNNYVPVVYDVLN